MGEVFACLVDGAPGFVRGDLVTSDDPRVAQHPEAFTPWSSPPPVETPDGKRTTEAFVVTESLARGDRLYVRGDVLDRTDPAIRAVKRCVTSWSPPPVRLDSGEVHACVPAKSSRGRSHEQIARRRRHGDPGRRYGSAVGTSEAGPTDATAFLRQQEMSR